MSLIRLLLGRRQFLFAFLGFTLTLALGRVGRVFGMTFQTGTAKASEMPAAGEKKDLKGIVVYYSATGNTAQVANALWRGMSSVIACDVAPMQKVQPADMARYDVMAIGSPNWYFRVPANVNIFTHDMPRMDGKHCIIFGTHGGMPVGQFWSMSRNILKKGMTIIGWSDWYGADFLTPHSCVPDGEWGHPDSIDLAEAEAFGKRMAEYSIRIYEGETDLLPEGIPAPDKGENSLWNPAQNESYEIQFAGGGRNAIPRFDLTKCVYPRCTRCIENCVVGAIDFSLLTTAVAVPDRTSTATPLVLKEACQHCGGVCERVCLYDAILYAPENGEKSLPRINMAKCTYPKCTICADECPQKAIDLTKTPPVIHNWCKGESLCWGLCPENAIEATSTSTGPGGEGGRGETSMGQGAMAGGPVGPGGTAQDPGPIGTYTARYRPLIQEECAIGRVSDLTVYPRIPLHKDLWPYHMDEA